jgi:16S rRNA (cytosine967-C5)-methyltransferase
MTAPARAAALRALLAIDARRRDLPAAIDEIRGRLADERDRALAAAIVHGTLRWQRACDHLIEHFARRSPDALDTDVRLILRLSLFQLLHLDRGPAAAVVDDAVDLTRRARKRSATGLVNAVLRSVLRQRRALPFPARPAGPVPRAEALRYLGVCGSHPDWLVARWLDRVGFDETERWLRFNNEPAPVMLAVNPLRGTPDAVQAALAANGIETARGRFAPHGLRVLTGHPLRRPLDGSVLVQDEASQMVTLAVDARPGERVLDLCAAPGNKTVALAGAMRDGGLLVACDVRQQRVALLHATLARAGARHGHVVHVDTDATLPFAAVFDRVLVDAPCSGLGTLRRDPDVKWRRQEADLAALAERQRALLARAAEVLTPGGRLVYATCSSEPEENEHVVDAFLAGRPDFAPIDLRADGPVDLAPLLDEGGRLRTHPPAHGLESFFAAAMTRRG